MLWPFETTVKEKIGARLKLGCKLQVVMVLLQTAMPSQCCLLGCKSLVVDFWGRALCDATHSLGSESKFFLNMMWGVFDNLVLVLIWYWHLLLWWCFPCSFRPSIQSWLERMMVFRFRLIAKSMAAFLAAQMPSDASLRLSADAPGAIGSRSSTASSPQQSSPPPCSPSQQARQTLAHLEVLRANKQYASLRSTVDAAIESVTSPDMSLRDANAFLYRLVTAVFPDVSYLEIIRRPSLWTAWSRFVAYQWSFATW